MAQSYSILYTHIVFSTKNRSPFLTDVPFRTRVHLKIQSISRKLSSHMIAIGGTEDHLHVFVDLSKSLACSEWIKETKRLSTIWIKSQRPDMRTFSWQKGYGAFAVSYSNREAVKTYVHNQVEHHKTVTFKDEYRALLTKHGIEWDERYVWD